MQHKRSVKIENLEYLKPLYQKECSQIGAHPKPLISILKEYEQRMDYIPYIEIRL